jgi:hypothetical protein
MKKGLYTFVVAALLVAGCNNEAGEMPQVNLDSNEIRIEAAVGGTRATATEFEEGDLMSLYAVEYEGDEVAKLQVSGNYLNNEAMTLMDGIWVGDRTLYWSEKPCDFYAVYPYQHPETVSEFLFDLPLDQNSPATDEALSGYEAADLLWAKAERVAREDGVVNMAFKHMMSRVVVKIERGPSYEGELPEDIVVHLYNTVTTAEVDLTKGSLQRYAYGDKGTITMKQLSADTFAAVVVPQNIERRTPLVEVTMEGIAYLLTYSTSFRPGYQHTITITLNTSPDQEKIEINIDGEIDGWD